MSKLFMPLMKFFGNLNGRFVSRWDKSRKNNRVVKSGVIMSEEEKQKAFDEHKYFEDEARRKRAAHYCANHEALKPFRINTEADCKLIEEIMRLDEAQDYDGISKLIEAFSWNEYQATKAGGEVKFVCDETNNNEETIARGELNAMIVPVSPGTLEGTDMGVPSKLPSDFVSTAVKEILEPYIYDGPTQKDFMQHFDDFGRFVFKNAANHKNVNSIDFKTKFQHMLDRAGIPKE